MSGRPSLLLLLVPAFAGVPSIASAVPAVGATARAAKPTKPGQPTKPSAVSTARSLLWATVNVCDTADAPDTIGIRGSMPGSGTRAERMYMRFQVEYLDATDGRWKAIGPSGDSGWISVGSGRYRARQSGRNFVVRPPSAGSF